ncbi:MAG: fatty acid desaturase family protein [Gemmatimonadetes bacterium]|nr:fatty acid desaturase family protein [Gemmatimonadota bacterium]
MTAAGGRAHPIPGAVNLCLLAGAMIAAGWLLAAASHAPRWWQVALAVLAFSYVNNTIFSLLHESVHRMFHRNRAVNEWGGRLAAAFFPTALAFQRVFHLRHHRNNRTEVEQFDYLRPSDNRALKYAQWYAILTGLYWTASPLGMLVFLVWPGAFRSRVFRADDSALAQQTAAGAMFEGFDDAPTSRIRLEILFTLLVQAALVVLAGATWRGWLLCYAAFGINWSSLQYADHAWSELDVREGAWNLRVNRVVQWLFLNYHHHKAHHQRPDVPWLYLSQHVDFSEPRPSFARIWLSMWRGPRPLPDDPA